MSPEDNVANLVQLLKYALFGKHIFEKEKPSFDAVRGSMWKKVWRLKAHSQDETFDHLLCTCSFACTVWKLSPFQMDFSGVQPTFWKKRWVELCNSWNSLVESEEYYGLAAFIYWSIWKSMNDLCFSMSEKDPFEVVQRALRDFTEFLEVYRQNKLSVIPSPPRLHPSKVWSDPAEGFLKLNFDAAFNSIALTCNGGMIVRNHLGQPIKMASIFFRNVSDPTLAEGLVLRTSLLLLKDWGYHSVVVEGDC
ncbi:uncharacterized protein LOC132277847 [Cornus florida]|uniref:uncharacterized protein LOC132277847 n=1 Tax=Cornus florida TaxID=4283 RepID=UPI00289A20E2|nr:uncharacterized protein LOC132277847 [Cornus florida]